MKLKEHVNASIAESIRELTFKMNAQIMRAFEAADQGQDPLVLHLPQYGMPEVIPEDSNEDVVAFRVVGRGCPGERADGLLTLREARDAGMPVSWEGITGVEGK